jgi:hypothetical protein
MGVKRSLIATPLLTLTVLLMGGGASAAAADPAADLTIHSLLTPSHFSMADTPECISGPLACDSYQVTVTNAGSLASRGPTMLEDVLPPGLKAEGVELFWSGIAGIDLGGLCEIETTSISCKLPVGLEPDATIELILDVTVQQGAVSGEVNTATVAEGGSLLPASQATAGDLLGSPPVPFAIGAVSSNISGVDGAPDSQAGGHSYELTTRIDLDTTIRVSPDGDLEPTAAQDLRDLIVDLPLGLAGSALSAPTCTLARLASKGVANEQGVSGCPLASAIGHIRTDPAGPVSVDSLIYNIAPERGVAAEFGYIDGTGGTHVLYVGLAPTPAGYVLRIAAREIVQVALTDLELEIYGDPALRDGASSENALFTFTNPSECDGAPLLTSIYMDSWQNPGDFEADGEPDLSSPNWVSSSVEAPPVAGCDLLKLEPTITVNPETSQADSPTGFAVDLKIPQAEGVEPGGTETLATPPLKRLTVTLPEGLTIDPSAANGLEGCSLAEVGMSSSGEPDGAPPRCPNASKIGTVELASALREGMLHGSIYLAAQNENPFHSLLALYVVSEDDGVIIKLAGELQADPLTGRLTVTLDDQPQLSVSELKLAFFGGAEAVLATPQSCGSFESTAELEPWSHTPGPGETAGTPNAILHPAFAITGCPSKFAPALAAGTVNARAGAYSPFRATFSRDDGEQELSGLTFTTPPGLLANLAGVPLCEEPQAARGECGPASLLGEATVAVGAGTAPYWIHGGRVYLTGPTPTAEGSTLQAAPFGLSIVVPAVVGPFDLGQVVVRAAIAVDPSTAALRVTTDQEVDGAGGIPLIKDGIPLRLRSMSIDIDRSGFFFNPTNCAEQSITGTVAGTQGAVADVASPFAATGCKSLSFSPKLTAVTRANGEFTGHGASLHLAIATTGGQANVRSLKLDLPQRLPARLETIQKACPEATFKQNPAGCSKASVVGSATVHTPILAGAMTGPAYLVAKSKTTSSGAGAGAGARSTSGANAESAFPNLVLVLQGDGVRIDLTGALYVSEKNITSIAFRTIPDVPIRRLDLILPEGKTSILAASSGLCTKKPLRIATALTAQNAAKLKPVVEVAVSGCKKPRRHKQKRRLKKS